MSAATATNNVDVIVDENSVPTTYGKLNVSEKKLFCFAVHVFKNLKNQGLISSDFDEFNIDFELIHLFNKDKDVVKALEQEVKDYFNEKKKEEAIRKKLEKQMEKEAKKEAKKLEAAANRKAKVESKKQTKETSSDETEEDSQETGAEKPKKTTRTRKPKKDLNDNELVVSEESTAPTETAEPETETKKLIRAGLRKPRIQHKKEEPVEAKEIESETNNQEEQVEMEPVLKVTEELQEEPMIDEEKPKDDIVADKIKEALNESDEIPKNVTVRKRVVRKPKKAAEETA